MEVTMKIICMIPVWRRPEILNICIQRFEVTRPYYADIEPVFVISKEDPDFDLNYQLVKDYKYLIYKNAPLGEKKNAGLNWIRQFEWDYYMDLNSDNVFRAILWHYYKPYFDTNTLYFGINNIFFYDIRNKKAYLVRGYNRDFNDKPSAIGPCRMVHRSIIEDVGDLWRNEHHTGMDGMSHFNINEKGHYHTLIDTGEEPFVLNMVTFHNLSPISTIIDMAQECNASYIQSVFGLDEITPDISLLTFDGFHTEVLKQAQQMPRKQDAFNQVNQRYQRAFGVTRYKTYESYKTTVSKIYGR